MSLIRTTKSKYAKVPNSEVKSILQTLVSFLEEGLVVLVMKRKNGSHGAMDGKLFAASNGMGANRPIEVAGHDDRVSMAVLLVLYTLQGIPMGLCSSLPVILKERGISFEDLALLSLASLPFSLKLLWAPIVDCKFFKSMGRRKSWLIPVQLLCGGVFIFGSKFVTEWIETQNIKALTGFFIFLYFLMATQDIAVDGWALTMLSPEHVGYASLCNSIGQSFGFFLANQGFIALNDPTWCFRHLGTRMGRSLIDLSGFMHFWGWVFIVVTLGIWFGKEEKDVEPGHEPDGLMETYQHVLSIFKLHPVQTLTIILLTCRVAFAPVDSAWNFKLMESVRYLNPLVFFFSRFDNVSSAYFRAYRKPISPRFLLFFF